MEIHLGTNMKACKSMLFAISVAALTAAAGGLIGVLLGNLVGERILGNKEPMIETVLGGALGVIVGVSAGGVLGLLAHRRWCGKK